MSEASLSLTPSRVDYQLIDQDGQLAAVLDVVQTEPRISIDTEFVREDTYHPKLGLIQIAAGSHIFCIDPLTVDCTPLFDLLFDDSKRKILHAARQDLEVLHQASGKMMDRIFDTQLAAAFLGLDHQIGFADLVKKMLGVSLDKSETRTNWLQRPLTKEQLQYAADDVRYLPKLHKVLKQRLINARRYHWLKEEQTRLYQTPVWEVAPDQASLRIRGRGKLDVTGQRVLATLAGWRETQAKTQDKPRNWIMSDNALLWLARERPASDGELKEFRHEKARDTYGKTLVNLIQMSIDKPASAEHQEKNQLSDNQRKLVKTLQQHISEAAGALHINAGLLATRADLSEFVRDKENNLLVTTWRKEALGESFSARK